MTDTPRDLAQRFSDCSTNNSPLIEAHNLIHGPRNDDYGHPLDDFTRSGRIWEAILGIPVSAEQVALCMVGIKISREVNHPKRDNAVDGAGYFGKLEMVKEERKRRKTSTKDLQALIDFAPNTSIHE